jgi:hypothetical protein
MWDGVGGCVKDAAGTLVLSSSGPITSRAGASAPKLLATGVMRIGIADRGVDYEDDLLTIPLVIR